MKRPLRFITWTGCVVAVLALLLGGGAQSEEKKTVTGTVEVTKDDDGNITAVSIADADVTQRLALDDKAKALAGDCEGKKVEATGTVGADGAMKLESYKEVKEEEPAPEED